MLLKIRVFPKDILTSVSSCGCLGITSVPFVELDYLNSLTPLIGFNSDQGLLSLFSPLLPGAPKLGQKGPAPAGAQGC